MGSGRDFRGKALLVIDLEDGHARGREK
jgi:hypothetical protein